MKVNQLTCEDWDYLCAVVAVNEMFSIFINIILFWLDEPNPTVCSAGILLFLISVCRNIFYKSISYFYVENKWRWKHRKHDLMQVETMTHVFLPPRRLFFLPFEILSLTMKQWRFSRVDRKELHVVVGTDLSSNPLIAVMRLTAEGLSSQIRNCAALLAANTLIPHDVSAVLRGRTQICTTCWEQAQMYCPRVSGGLILDIIYSHNYNFLKWRMCNCLFVIKHHEIKEIHKKSSKSNQLDQRLFDILA